MSPDGEEQDAQLARLLAQALDGEELADGEREALEEQLAGDAPGDEAEHDEDLGERPQPDDGRRPPCPDDEDDG